MNNRSQGIPSGSSAGCGRLLLLSRQPFTYIYFLNALFYAAPIPNVWFASRLMKLLLLWGLLIIICDVCTVQRGLKPFHARGLFLFILWECLSFTANLDGNIYRGLQDILYNSIFFFVIYGQESGRDEMQRRNELYRFNQILIVFMFLAGGLSLAMFFGRVSFTYYYKGLEFHQGLYARRLNGCIGANAGSVLGLLSIAASLINYRIKRKHFALYLLNALVQLSFISLASSRGAFVTAGAIWIFFCMFYCYKRWKRKFYYIVPSMALSVCLILAGIWGYQKGMAGLNSALGSWVNRTVSHGQQEKQNGVPRTAGQEKVALEQAAQRSKREADITTGRAGMWKAAFTLFSESPVLGYSNAKPVDHTGRVYVNSDVLSEEDLVKLKEANGYLHNNYIQILLSVGLCGTAGIAVFILRCACDAYRRRIKRRDRSRDFINALLLSMLGSLMVNSLFESHLLFHQGDSIGVIFWFYLGFIMRREEERHVIYTGMYETNLGSGD